MWKTYSVKFLYLQKYQTQKQQEYRPLRSIFWLDPYAVHCTIWYHFNNFKNMKNTHGRVLVSILIKAKVSHVFFLIVEMVPNHATYLVVTRSIIYRIFHKKNSSWAYQYNNFPKYYLSLREKCPNTELFLVRIFLYSVRIQENTDQNNSVYGHFSRSVLPMLSSFLLFISCLVPHS